MERLPGWTDRDGRQPTSFPAIVVLPDGTRWTVIITNISSEGCQLETPEPLPIGKTVRIELAGDISADANVRWSIDRRAGLRFSLPLDN